MRSPSLLLLILILVAVSISYAQQKSPAIDKARLAEEVRNEFLHSWNAYKKYAWGHDGLRPLSKTSYDWYSVPLYMTALDALDTMILMCLK